MYVASKWGDSHSHTPCPYKLVMDTPKQLVLGLSPFGFLYTHESHQKTITQPTRPKTRSEHSKDDSSLLHQDFLAAPAQLGSAPHKWDGWMVGDIWTQPNKYTFQVNLCFGCFGQERYGKLDNPNKYCVDIVCHHWRYPNTSVPQATTELPSNL